MRASLTQEFLRSGGTIKELYQKYDIDCIESEHLNIIGFNYRNLSPLQEPLVRECRGLILEKGTWNVVCRSMDAFFSYQSPITQEMLPQFDWESALATEKRDGAIICLYYYQGAWRVGSRVSPDGQWQAFSINGTTHHYSWEELVKLTLNEMGTSWDIFTEALDVDIFYSFELCGPEVRVGVLYPNRTLTLIAAVDRNSLNELDIYSMDFPTLKPDSIKVNSIEEVWQACAGKDGIDFEGYVLKDKNFNRIKVINPSYAEQQQIASRDSEKEQIKALRTYMMFSSSGDESTLEDSSSGGGILSLGVFTNITPTMLSRLVRMTGATSIKYGEIMNLPEEEFNKEADAFFWPEGLKEMRKTNLAVTDLVEALPDMEIQELLEKYEASQN